MKSSQFSSDELHKEAGLLKLKFRREQHLLNFVYDWSLDENKLKSKPLGSVSTRSQEKQLIRLGKKNSYSKNITRMTL